MHMILLAATANKRARRLTDRTAMIVATKAGRIDTGDARPQSASKSWRTAA